jgi:hypothetical protein
VNPDPDATELVVERAPVTGRRPLMSAAVVGAVAIAFLGLAITKPWGPDIGPAVAQQPEVLTPAPSVSAVAPSLRVAALRRPPAVMTLPSGPFSAEVVGATVRRDAWGIRAVVVPAGAERFDVGGPGLAERWMPIDVPAGAVWNLGLRGTPERWGDTVLALGPTTPADVQPVDVRFWRFDDADVRREIAAVPVPTPKGGTHLWLPDPANSTTIGTWPAGVYQIDLVADARTVRMVVIVEDDLSTN